MKDAKGHGSNAGTATIGALAAQHGIPTEHLGPQYQHSTALPGVPYNRNSAEPARSQQARELFWRAQTLQKMRKAFVP